jgi:hypothetical protein
LVDRRSVRVQTSDDVLLPLYEAKLIDRYHHRFGDFADQDPASRGSELPNIPDERLTSPTYFVQSRHWIPEREVLDRTRDVPTRWLCAWRDITNAASERTTRVAVLPQVGIGNSAPHLWFAKRDVPAAPLLLAVLNSFVLDFVARQKVAGLHLNFLHMKQFPVPGPAHWTAPCRWTGRPLGDFVRPRILELVYTAWDLQAFALDYGCKGPPFKWDRERRLLLQCELDAAMFHLFEISKDEAAYILDSFPLVRRGDENSYGEFRTKLQILDVYEGMRGALAADKDYGTVLDPPPADPRVAHPESTRPEWAVPSERILEVPAMPGVFPMLDPAREAAICVWALLHAAGGTITRTDLARAFVLRSQPALLRKLVPPDIRATAAAWASRVVTRSVDAGALAGAVTTLANRDGITLTTNASGQSAVAVSAHTPPEAQIDEWFRFEARLALRVLAALPAAQAQDVDAALPDADRVVLCGAGVA